MSRSATYGTDAARDAYGRHEWARAFELLSQMPVEELEAADLEALAESAWWTARLEECIAARERAFALYTSAGDNRRAAVVAINLAKDHFAKSAGTVGMAWMGRAERLLAGEGDSIEAGILERTRAVMAHEGEGDYEKAIGHARSALEIATAHGNQDLMALALQDEGRAAVAKGEVERGMELLDEATVAAVSGDLSPMTTGVIYCNVITICEEIADYGRAAQWTDVAKRWCDRQEIAGFPGLCRVHRAGIIRLRGSWAEAEDEALRAADELKDFNHSYAAEAFYQLGEIRFERGDLALAEDAFYRAHELGREPQPGMALLQLAQGKTKAAVAGITRALDEEVRDLHRVRLLRAYGEILDATGSADELEGAAEELYGLAETYQTPVLRAAAEEVSGRLAVATGDLAKAVSAFRGALRGWQQLAAPYLVAKGRVLLASAYRTGGESEAADLELSAARSAFQALGAARDLALLDGEAVAVETALGKDADQAATLRREGEYWLVSYGDASFRLKDSKGLQLMAELLRNPHKEFHALELMSRSAPPTPAVSRGGELEMANGGTGAALDDRAKAAYRLRYEDLTEELDEARRWGDAERATKAEREMEFLAAEMASAVGLGGRDRQTGSDSERARVNVTRTIRAALDRIRQHSPGLGDHLSQALNTGTYCSYRPDPTTTITWNL